MKNRILLTNGFDRGDFAGDTDLSCVLSRPLLAASRTVLSGAPLKSGVSITAVIPARDEAASIGRAVGSLKTQQFAGVLRIIVAWRMTRARMARKTRRARIWW